jgi:hypothetical protein
MDEPDWSIPLATDDAFGLPFDSNFDAGATKQPAGTDSEYPDPSYYFSNLNWDDRGTQVEQYEYTTTLQAHTNTFNGFKGQKSLPQERSWGPSLPRRRSKYSIRRTGSSSRPITIPVVRQQNESTVQSLAMQRWQNSPPEDEAASLSAIYTAVEQRPLDSSPLRDLAQSFDTPKIHRVPSSTTSLESGASGSSIQSVNSNLSATSQTRTHTRVTKPRRPRKANRKTNTADRIFKCTFCCDTFKHKYDWTRHEKSLHLNMEEWICTPHGGIIISPSTGEAYCVYCKAQDPTYEHLQTHNHSVCHGAQTPRTFRRKDHLVQHLRLVHTVEELPLIDDWKIEPMTVSSRCGFCNGTMQSWDERADHLATHFRSGKTMADWKGDHAFEPEVNARVTHAYPPYLIASQAITLVPFSATNHDSIDHTIQIMSNIEMFTSAVDDASNTDQRVDTLTDSMQSYQLLHDPSAPAQQGDNTMHLSDILTRHLARFAREQMLQGVVPTDEMFQRESRRIQFNDEDDDWNQTVADDPDWLREFRVRTGILEVSNI